MKKIVAGAVLGLALLGCGKKDGGAEGQGDAKPPAAAPAAAPTPTGKIIKVEMVTDEKGSRFEPSEITADEGDILRFTLEVGVHNVHFVADSNPRIPNLPAASEMLQLPGQEFDVPVQFGSGKVVYFQCDPHAALGMKGHVTVR